MKLEDWRKEIDLIDDEIIKLINQRARIVQKIGTLKAKAGLPIVDKDREEKVLRKVCEENQGILKNDSIAGIYRKILHESKTIQEDVSKKISNKGVEIY